LKIKQNNQKQLIKQLKFKIMKAIVQQHPKTGEVITLTTSKDGKFKYGKIMVKSTTLTVNASGFFTPQSRAAFITIPEEHLELAKNAIIAGKEVPFAGRIQRVESREAQYEGHAAKQVPGKDGEPNTEYLLNGAEVYFTDTWNPDVSCVDTLISADKSMVESVKEVSAEAQA
jgi:hypothetical protein